MPCGAVNNSDGRIVIDTNIHANNVIARELDDGVIGRNSKDENGLVVLDFHQWQGDLTLRKAGIIELKNQPVSYTLDNHFENNFPVDKRVVLNDCVLLVGDSKVNKIFAIRRRGSVYGALPTLRNMLRAFSIRRRYTFLPGAKRCNSVMANQPLFTRPARLAFNRLASLLILDWFAVLVFFCLPPESQAW